MYEESALHSRALFYVVYSGSAVRYLGGCLMKYIDDFSNISTTTRNISAIISIYQRFDKEYRFVDKVRQKKSRTYPPRNILYEKRTTRGKTKILTNPPHCSLNLSKNSRLKLINTLEKVI